VAIKLHVFPASPRAFKVLLAAQHLGIDYELKVVDLGTGQQRTPQFATLNVNQRMPVLEDDGYVLWESNAILEYLAAQKPQAALMPTELRPRLQVAKWLYWESAHWDQAIAIFMFERVVKTLFNMGTPVDSEIARGTTLLKRLGPVLDGELQKHRYIAGDTLTLADLSIISPFCHSELARFPLEPYRAIHRWVADMKALPAWSRTIALQRPAA
jgi:glutathione S-transferase